MTLDLMRSIGLVLRKSLEPSTLYMSCSVSGMFTQIKNKLPFSEAKGQSDLTLHPL